MLCKRGMEPFTKRSMQRGNDLECNSKEVHRCLSLLQTTHGSRGKLDRPEKRDKRAFVARDEDGEEENDAREVTCGFL